jgi:hypothetical protein
MWLIQTNLCAGDLALQEVSLALETGGRKMGLRVNEEKTKCMRMFCTHLRRHLQTLAIGDFKLEVVDSFTYLGSAVDSHSKLWTCVYSEVMTANRACVAHTKFFSPKVLPRSAKLKLYETLVRLILT